MSATRWTLPIARWSAWWPGRPGAAEPDLRFIEPLLRRRLSPLARAALHVAHACVGDIPAVRCVYASRHGELARTVDMLRDLAWGEALSPATFSLSVLNANAGLFSIIRGDTSPTTALAAGADTFGFGLLEAASRVALDAGAPLLFLYADAPAPEPLQTTDGDVADILTVGLLIDPAAAATMVETAFEAAAGGTPEEPQALAFLRCLEQGSPTHWAGPDRRWTWAVS